MRRQREKLAKLSNTQWKVLSLMWVLGIKFQLSGLAADLLTGSLVLEDLTGQFSTSGHGTKAGISCATERIF